MVRFLVLGLTMLFSHFIPTAIAQGTIHFKGDVIFVNDESSSVRSSQLDLVSSFSQAIVRNFSVWGRPGGTRVGLISFAAGVTLRFGLTTHERSQANAVAAFAGFTRLRGSSSTDQALIEAKSHLDTNPRTGVPRIVCVITDGMPSNQRGTIDAAESLKAAGYKILLLAVGGAARRSSDLNYLRGLTSDPSFFMSEGNFNALSQLVDASLTAFKTLNAFKGDVLFLNDESSSMDSTQLDTVAEFLQGLVRKFSVWGLSEGTRVGLISFASDVQLRFGLTTHERTQADAVAGFSGFTRLSSSGISTDQALTEAKNNHDDNARAGVTKVVFIITDDSPTNADRTVSVANTLKAAGYHIFVFAVGQVTGISSDLDNLRSLTSDPRYFIVESDFGVLSNHHFEILNLFHGIVPPAPPTTPPTRPACNHQVYLSFNRNRFDVIRRVWIPRPWPKVSIGQRINPSGTVGGGAARFSGQNKLEMSTFKGYTYGHKILVRVRFHERSPRPAGATGAETIYGNGDCNVPATLKLSYYRDQRQIVGMIRVNDPQTGRTVKAAAVNNVPGDTEWKETELRYDGSNLALSVRTPENEYIQTANAPASGDISSNPTSFKIGGECNNEESFYGDEDEFYMYGCFP